MHKTDPAIAPWYARLQVQNLAVVVTLSLATLAVVLALEYATHAPSDVPSVGDSVPHVDQLGAVLAHEHSSPALKDAPPATNGAPSVSNRDPSLPDISFIPNARDAQEPAPPTF